MLPTAAADRKAIPVATGMLDYFPAAVAAVAELSRIGNDQHNPGKPLHWDRSKSTDEADCMLRHFIQRGTLDTDGVRHSAKVAWRAMALLQKEIEKEANLTKPMAMADVVAHFQDRPGAASTPNIDVRCTAADLEAATRQRAAHNADKNTRHGGLPVMDEQKQRYYFGLPFEVRRFVPESRFGFTIGDKVNLPRYGSHNPGRVVGFSPDKVYVLWNHNYHPGAWLPTALVHQA